jgi:hypothetical protein
VVSGQHTGADLRWFLERGVPLNDRSADADYSRKVRVREESAWRRYGPVRYRLVKLLRLAVLLAGAYLSTIAFNTLAGFYPGTGSVGAQGAAERAVQVTVESCERVGPLHDRRLGLWWICRVRLPGGGTAEVDRSIVTADDVGRTVELRKACFDPSAGRCGLGKPTGAGWELYAGAVHYSSFGLFAGLLVWAFTCLLAAVVGAPGYVSFIDWWQRRMVRGR